MTALSIEAKSIIGIFADFVGAKRTALLSSDFVTQANPPATLASPTRGSAKIEPNTADPAPSETRPLDAGDPPESGGPIPEKEEPLSGETYKLL
jgi:hypothetical protein